MQSRDENKLYTVVFNSGGNEIYRNRIEECVLLQLDHFRGLLSSGMIETTTDEIKVTIDGITAAAAESYLLWLCWRYLGFAGEPPCEYNPYSVWIADYFCDDLYIHGNYCPATTIKFIQMSSYNDPDADDNLIIPAGFYTNDQMIDVFMSAVNKNKLGVKFNVLNFTNHSNRSMFDVGSSDMKSSNYALSVESTSETPFSIRQYTLHGYRVRITFKPRKYDLDDICINFHNELPEHIVDDIYYQYLIEIYQTSGKISKRFCNFIKINSIVAEAAWEEISLRVCSELDIPSSAKIIGKKFNELIVCLKNIEQ